MTLRIVLSCLALALLAVLLAACSSSNGAAYDDVQANGLGTSPSDPTADPVTAGVSPLEAPPPTCGIWVAASEALADLNALAGGAPDVVVWATGRTTCADAIAIAAERWPGRAVVRYAAETWGARVPP